MEKKLYILRHGETNENKAGIVQGQGIDSSLNELGLWQSLQFYNKYKSITFDKIITSGLRRSYQTLQHFETTENEIQRDTRINEISWGEHEGKAGEPELMEKYYKIINSWKSGDYLQAPIGGESALDLYQRVDHFLKEVSETNCQTILACTHGRTLRALVCCILQLPLSEMENIKQSNSGLYIFELHDQSWKLISENDTSHLSSNAEI